MVLGVIPISAFTVLHVIISLAAIASGIVVVVGMIGSRRLPGWTAVFLALTVLTSVTGFLFPIRSFTPALGTGIISMIVLLIALVALYGRHLARRWRRVYIVTAVLALWFNVFVLIVQAFLKVPSLHALAPNGNEPAFLATQAAVLVVFILLGAAAAVRFRPAPLVA